MSQIPTSIEQSKRLLEAGVPKGSADMKHTRLVIEADGGGYFSIGPRKDFHIEVGNAKFEDEVPAWSLSALWQMIHDLDKTYEFPTSLSADELIETLVTTIIHRRKNQ